MIYPDMAYINSIHHDVITSAMGPIQDADLAKLEVAHSEALSLEEWKGTFMI